MAEQLKSPTRAITRTQAPTNVVGGTAAITDEKRPTGHPIQALLLLIIYASLLVAFAILCG